jgi:hypothetical protein
MDRLELSDWSEYFLRRKLRLLSEKYEELEHKFLEMEKRLLELEAYNESLAARLNTLDAPTPRDEIWLKIRGRAIEAKSLQLLNPSKKFVFQIVEVSDDFIRVDKLGQTRLTRDMFLSVLEYLKAAGEWVRIGASVRGTKPDTVEGHLKSKFHGGDMNAKMTAPWLSAMIVAADVGVEFNNKSVGQSLRYVRR